MLLCPNVENISSLLLGDHFYAPPLVLHRRRHLRYPDILTLQNIPLLFHITNHPFSLSPLLRPNISYLMLIVVVLPDVQKRVVILRGKSVLRLYEFRGLGWYFGGPDDFVLTFLLAIGLRVSVFKVILDIIGLLWLV